MIKKNKIFFEGLSILAILISIIFAIWHARYINDGYHWGFIFANSLDFSFNKKPYIDIFLEYGYLQILINNLIFKVFGKVLIFTHIFVILSYAIGVYMIGCIVFELTQNKFYKFLSISIILCIFPWPTQPWPNFIFFLFSTLFIFSFLKDKTEYYILSGIFIFLAYLSYTTLSNFFYFIFFLLLFFFKVQNYFFYKKIVFDKTDITWLVFFLLLIIYIIYIFIFLDINLWILYQKIPFFISKSLNSSIFVTIKNYLNFTLIHPFRAILYEPQFIIYLIFLLFNFYYIIINFFNKKCFINFKLFTISIYCLSINIFSFSLNLEYLATSTIFGILFLFIFINNLKINDNKTIVIFYLIFLSFFSLLNIKMGYSKFSENRYLKFKDIPYSNKYKIKVQSIELFKYQIWDEDYVLFLERINKKILNIRNKCKNIAGINLTDNSNIYNLFYDISIQKIPFILNDNVYKFNKIFDKNLNKKILNKIKNNSVFFVSKQDVYNLKKNKNFKSYKYILKNNKTINKVFMIIYPSRCD